MLLITCEQVNKVIKKTYLQVWLLASQGQHLASTQKQKIHYELSDQNLEVSGGNHTTAQRIHLAIPSGGKDIHHHGTEYPNP